LREAREEGLYEEVSHSARLYVTHTPWLWTHPLGTDPSIRRSEANALIATRLLTSKQ
jgi:hypothetical protein